MGEKYVQEFAPILFMGGPRGAHPLGPHVGPPTWAQAWAQTPPPAPAPPAPPDEFSDPNLTPLPTHPGIKYVARSQESVLRHYVQNVGRVLVCRKNYSQRQFGQFSNVFFRGNFFYKDAKVSEGFLYLPL